MRFIGMIVIPACSRGSGTAAGRDVFVLLEPPAACGVDLDQSLLLRGVHNEPLQLVPKPACSLTSSLWAAWKRYCKQRNGIGPVRSLKAHVIAMASHSRPGPTGAPLAQRDNARPCLTDISVLVHRVN